MNKNHISPVQYLFASVAWVVLAVVLVLAASKAHAQGYYSSGGSCSNCTPLDLCDEIYEDQQDSVNCIGGSRTCGVIGRRTGNGAYGSWNIKVCVSPSGVSYANAVMPTGGGHPCWTTAWDAGSNNPPATHGCDVCTAPLVLNEATGQCEQPECEEGEIWDEDIQACRAECSEEEFFHYETQSCQKQCPVGKEATAQVVSNAPLRPSTGPGATQIPTINGCAAEHHFKCIPDETRDGGGYYSGADYTGRVCLNWWTYYEAWPVEMISQAEYEEQTGGAAGYTGESASPAVTGMDLDSNAGQQDVYAEGDDAIDITSVSTLCLAGTKRMTFMVNGSLEHVVFLGPCAEPDEDVPAPGPTGDAALARVESKVDTANVALQAAADQQDTDSAKLDALQTTGDEIKALAEALGTSMENVQEAIENLSSGSGEETCEGEGCQIDGGAFPTVNPEELYEKKYENAGEGIAEVAGAAGALNAESQLHQFMTDLQPVWPTTVPECLSWSIVAPVVGTVEVQPPCFMWDLLAAFTRLIAVITAWGMLFGVRQEG